MEHLRPELEKVKEMSREILDLTDKKNTLTEQLNQYRSSVSGYINKLRRAESLLEIEHDEDLVTLTNSTNSKMTMMENKIHAFNNELQSIHEQYDILFEKRRVIVVKLDKELNKTITYAYPFGMEPPTIRMGKFYHITDEGDVMCEMRFESNSFFDSEFHQTI